MGLCLLLSRPANTRIMQEETNLVSNEFMPCAIEAGVYMQPGRLNSIAVTPNLLAFSA